MREQSGLYLVSGHVGTGKSTELFRLVDHLSDTHRCFLEQVDADLWRGSAAETAFLNLLILALEALGTNTDWREVWGRGAFAGKIRKLTRGLVGSKPKLAPAESTDNTALLEQLEKTWEKVQAQSLKPLIVLDGFDKVGLADLEQLFTSVFSWGALPVSVVLTVPISFMFTPMFVRSESQFASTAVVPPIRVSDRGGRADPAGVEWMHSVFARRGVAELFDTDATDHLIVQTGGILRDFLRVARESVLTAHMNNKERVTREYATNAVQDFSVNLSRAVSPDDLRLLYAVHKAGRVIGDRTFLQMIDSGHVIEYRNGANWYALHPLLRRAVEALGTETWEYLPV